MFHKACKQSTDGLSVTQRCRGGRVATSLLFALWVLGFPVAASAQLSTSGITGVVRDTVGGVLPGVTVEVASPALIEGVKVAATDAEGRYRFIDLRPGTYEVTFTLPGFTITTRTNIQLTAGFTAPVNAELNVATVEETVTVVGSSPLVDVQNVRTQTVLSREKLDTLPTGGKSFGTYAALIVGAAANNHDVGGNKGEAAIGIVIHGGHVSSQRMTIDGMLYNGAFGSTGGSNRLYWINQATANEITFEASGMSAETETSGLQVNVIPKEGGNAFSGVFNTSFGSQATQWENLTDDFRARGLTEAPSVKLVGDVGGGFGGALVEDRLWFYTGHRWWKSDEFVVGSYTNATQGTPVYTPDLDDQQSTSTPARDNSIRLTWLANENHKLTFLESLQQNCFCLRFPGHAPEAGRELRFWPVSLTQGTWTYTATNRLLFQAGFTYGHNRFVGDRVEGVNPDDINIFELSRGFLYNAPRPGLGYGGVDGRYLGHQYNGRFSVAYVTGSHNFKAGYTHYLGLPDSSTRGLGVSYLFRNGRPLLLTQFATPHSWKLRGNMGGVYAQDQWTLRNLTLNLGVRFDIFRAHGPAQSREAGEFVPAIDFPAKDLLSWNDVAPRLGAAYDLFGNGKSAIKVSLGRYVEPEIANFPRFILPINSIVLSANRLWNDANEDFVPQEEELGPLSNAAFGTVQSNTSYAPDVTDGWGVRPYSWTGSVVFEQEIASGVGLQIGYYRTWYGNCGLAQDPGASLAACSRAVDNLLVTPADYDPFCVTAPTDSRLPGGGGNEICGLYDINPAVFGLVDNLVTQPSNFGKSSEVYNGVDVTVDARLEGGLLLAGGVSWGRQTIDNCYVVDSPQQRFCRHDNPAQLRGNIAGGTQVKFQAFYPLPWDLQTGVVFQSLPGTPILARYNATNAEIAPSLGRNLGACGTQAVCRATFPVDLIEPGTMYEDRLNQVDLNLKRNFRLGGARFSGGVEVYNVLNAGTLRGVVSTYGGAWLRPTQIIGGRLVRFSAQVDF